MAPKDLACHGLRWSSDAEPGLTRRRRGKGFSYHHPDGSIVRDPATLERVRSLAVPPAYRAVWICADDAGHLQATGLDARGRKQYGYHPQWLAVQEQAKFHRLRRFGEVLPSLRRRVAHDLGRPGLPPEKVIAAVVRLLEQSLIRVGNPEYARDNDSYGLTTLREEHVDVAGAEIRFSFRGKSGKEWQVGVRDPRAARVVARCQDLPGQELFQWVDEDGARHAVGSGDVNAYLHEHAGGDVTAKDFRTWAGTALAFRHLQQAEAAGSRREIKARLKAALQEVAGRLGNTVTVCRRSYVHPSVIECFEAGQLERDVRKAAARIDDAPAGLRAEERLLWAFLAAAERKAARRAG